MLDGLTASVLGAVNAASDGSYKVLEAGELLGALPAEEKTDEAGLENALRYLSERGYIDLRYSDGGTFCLCSLPKGRSYAETLRAEQSAAKPSAAPRGRWLSAFLGAFAGGFAGALAAWALSLLF